MDFADNLIEAVREKKTPVLVGIDPRPEELPPGFLDKFPGDRPGIAAALRTFGCGVIDVVAPLVAAVKFQSAFYEAYGPEGLGALHATVEYAKRQGLYVIFDGKRNDIGSTAEAYARAYLGKVPVGNAFDPSWHADAMTVNPYLGTDSVMPFVKIAAREHKGVFVLVRTSNASAREFHGPSCATASPSTATSPGRCWTGPLGTRGPRVTTSSGRSSARRIPRSSRQSPGHARDPDRSYPDTEHREGPRSISPRPSTRTGWGRSSIIREGSPTRMPGHRTSGGSAMTGKEPSARPSTT